MITTIYGIEILALRRPWSITGGQIKSFLSLLPAVTEIKIYKAFNYFMWTNDQAPESNMAFRRPIALSFINNNYIRLEEIVQLAHWTTRGIWSMSS